MRHNEAVEIITTLSAEAGVSAPGTMYELEKLIKIAEGFLYQGENGDCFAYRSALQMFDALWICLFAGRFGNLFGNIDSYMPFFGVIWVGQRIAQFGFYGIDPSELPPLYNGLPTHHLFYFRPLVSSGRFFVPNQFPPNRKHFLSLPKEPAFLTIEATLNRVFFPDFLTVAFGGLYDCFGMARVMIRTDWQHAVTVTQNLSNVIFILPSDTEGIEWEIKYLCDTGQLNKVVLIMLPNFEHEITGNPFYSDDYCDISVKWKTAIPLFKKAGIRLPNYNPFGSFLFLNRRGGLDAQIPFASLWHGDLFKEVSNRFAKHS